MIETAPEIAALLVGAAFAAGFIDSIAGGGGLITVPALMLAGADPVTALATNKLQGLFGAGSATVSYARAGQVDLRRQAGPAAIACLASVAGALLASSLPVDTIRAGLPVLLIAIALFFALRRGLGDADRAQRVGPLAFALTAVPAIAFYDGLVGPGAGAFYMIALVTLAGYGILRATAHTKFLNFASNIGGIAAFAVVAAPWWTVGLMMGAAQVAGAALGARLAVRIGARLIRPLLVTVATLMALRLLTESWG